MDLSEIERAFIGLKRQAMGMYPDRAGTALSGVFVDVYALTQACLLNDASAERVSYLVGEVAGIVDHTMSVLPEAIQPDAKIACKKGCAHCCSIRVTTTPPEALAIAAHLRSLDGGAGGLSDKFRAYEAKSELSADERLYQVLECPFLSRDLCTIYAHRPKACRSYHSYDVLRCIADKRDPRALVGVPQDPMRHELGSTVFDAMGEACQALGLEFYSLELVPAVRIALEEPDAASRWLAREKVFASAHRPELIALSLAATESMNEG